ncbi:MAG: M23 family metallopeptidase [Patescibacteria group bacterium]
MSNTIVNKIKKYGLSSPLRMANIRIKLGLAIILFAISYLAINIQNVNADYGLNSKIKQVKTINNPTVYYLDYNKHVKKAYINAKAFLAYNNKWSDIKIISNKELNKWPEVKLVKANNNPTVYYISNNQKALIKSEQQFINFGFKWRDIITIAQADLNEYKIIDFEVAGTIDDPNETRISTSLDSSSPKADYLAINTQDNLVAVFNLKADSKLVKIKKLVLNLKGVFSADIIKEIYLTNESDIQYPVSASLDNRQATFNFNSQPLVVQSGDTGKIKVYVNFNNSASDVTNHTIQIAINQADNIDGAKAEGAFPLVGEIFKLASGGDYLGKVVINEQSLNISNNEAIVGSTEKNIGKFNIAETSGITDIFVKELKFLNKGNARADSLNNFKLKNNAGQIVATVGQLTDSRELIFKFNNNYRIKKGNNETFIILADVINGENSVINFYLDKAKIASAQGNFNLQPNIVNFEEIIVIKRKALAIIAKELKANNNVFAQQTGVIIGNFEIRNNNQKINIEQLGFSLEKNNSAPNLTETVYLVNYNSGEVYGYFDGNKFSNNIVYVSFNDLKLNAKQNLIITLITKIGNNVVNGDYYKIILTNIDYRSEDGAYFSDIINSEGNRLTVSKSNLYLYPNNDLGEQAFIKGQKNIKIANFIVEGASGGDTKITGLSFSQGNSSGIISFANGFSNLRASIGSARSKVIKAPYSNDLVFDGFKYILKSGERAEINIYADTEIDLKASEVQLKISNLVAMDNNSSLPTVINNLGINSYKVVFGEVKAEISKVAEGFVVKGEDDNVIAGFKVKNSGAEDLKLRSITINAADQELTYSLGYSNLKIIDRDKQKNAGSTISKPVAGANKINLNNYIIKAGEEIVFDVHIKTNNNIADKNIAIYFSNLIAQGKTSKVSAVISGDPTDSFKFVPVVGNNNQTEKFIKPVAGSITYGFHDPNYPYRDSFEHSGIDIDVAQGTKVKAVADGIVVEMVIGIGDQASYVTINHSDTLSTKYAHLSQIDVQAGDKVKQGDVIGLSGGKIGTSGAGKYSNGPHLHFEVLENGVAVDPEKYL